MINHQRTVIPNWILNWIIHITTVVLLLCLSYTTRLLRSLASDRVNPIPICEKIGRLKGPQYIAHLALVCALILRGGGGKVPYVTFALFSSIPVLPRSVENTG